MPGLEKVTPGSVIDCLYIYGFYETQIILQFPCRQQLTDPCTAFATLLKLPLGSGNGNDFVRSHSGQTPGFFSTKPLLAPLPPQYRMSGTVQP